jgi:signal transduction histidine kinase
MNAVVGGIRSHRRLGPFFEEQIQGVLDELVKSKDVLAAAVIASEGQLLLAARRTDLLDLATPIAPCESWQPAGFRLVKEIHLVPEPCGPGGGRGGGAGRRGGRGRGRGGSVPDEEPAVGPFSSGGDFGVALLLDRTGADAQLRRAAWSRLSVAGAGGLVLLCVGVVWRATVRLAAARGTLKAETRHLQELNRAAAGLAHETRNPLGLIRGWTQRLAESGLGTPEEQQQAQAIVEECDRVTARINQFLTFARPNQAHIEAIDLEAVLTELGVLLEPDFSARQLTFRTAVPPSGQTVRADREMLRQALFNAIQNAVQWSPEGGTVEVHVRCGHHDRCRIEVADRGPGVPPAAISSLFTPYFTTRVDGTGLGLAIIRRIAAAHGWEAGYTPRPGGGSVFWLEGIQV